MEDVPFQNSFGLDMAMSGQRTGSSGQQMTRTNLEMIHDYWNGLRGSRAQPLRSEFNPGHVPAALGDTFILDLDQSGQFPFRIAGSRICSLFGHDMQGLPFLTPFDEADRKELSGIIQNVASTRVIAQLVLRASTRDGLQDARFGLVLLPMGAIAKGCGRMLGAMAPLNVVNWLGIQPVLRFAIEQAAVERPASPSQSSATLQTSTARSFLRLVHSDNNFPKMPK